MVGSKVCYSSTFGPLWQWLASDSFVLSSFCAQLIFGHSEIRWLVVFCQILFHTCKRPSAPFSVPLVQQAETRSPSSIESFTQQCWHTITSPPQQSELDGSPATSLPICTRVLRHNRLRRLLDKFARPWAQVFLQLAHQLSLLACEKQKVVGVK